MTSKFAGTNLPDTDTQTDSLFGHRRGSGREEITPHNKSNAKASAEEVEIIDSSIHSSGPHRHKLITESIYQVWIRHFDSTVQRKMHILHTQTTTMVFKRWGSVFVLCYQRSSWLHGRDQWTQELIHCILSAPDWHFILLNSYFTTMGPCNCPTRDHALARGKDYIKMNMALWWKEEIKIGFSEQTPELKAVQ